MIQGLYPIFNHWHATGTVWVFSDPHFGDNELRAGQPDRPTDDEIVANINSKVGRKDCLIILGDVGSVEYVAKLRGRKILVCGNHDIGATNYQRTIQKKKFDSDRYTKEEAIAEMKALFPNCRYTVEEGYDFHSPFEYWEVSADNCLFDEVYTGPIMIGEKLILSHEPIPNLTWAVNLHGHDHSGRHNPDDNHYNFCAEAIGFRPVNLNQWMKEGHLAHIQSLHRDTINTATKRAKKRGHKLGEKK